MTTLDQLRAALAEAKSDAAISVAVHTAWAATSPHDADANTLIGQLGEARRRELSEKRNSNPH